MALPSPSSVLAVVSAFERAIKDSGSTDICQRTLEAIEAFRGALADEFEVAEGACNRKHYRTLEEVAEHRRLQKAFRYQEGKAESLRAALAQAKAKKVSGEISPIWFVRVGLSDPNLSARQLRELCRNFIDDEHPISATRIGATRDAFAEILKMLRSDQVSKSVAATANMHNGQTVPIFVCHQHDEAEMRFKSYGRVEPALVAALGRTVEPFSRARTSKVQNDLIQLKFVDQSKKRIELEWLSEISCLELKDVPTIATALVTSCRSVLDAIVAGLRMHPGRPRQVRVIHLLVGDAVGTNEAAAKRALAYFKSGRHGLPVKYSLVVFRCSGHQCNLVVLVVIAESLVSKPIQNNGLCGTCVRLYKYLMPSCLFQFEAALRNYVVSNVTLCHDVDSHEAATFQQEANKLFALYGDGVLPPDLRKMYNRNLKKPEHLVSDTRTIEEIRAAFYDVLYRRRFIIDETPVVTRMFTFTDCCWALLRLDLLGLPCELFSIHSMKMSDEGSKRLRRV